MAKLSTTDKQILEKLFQMGGGYVLNFIDRTMSEFFRDDIGINIYDKKYAYGSGSKANIIRGFWLRADDKLVGKSILSLLQYIKGQLLIGKLKANDFPQNLMLESKKIAYKLLGKTEAKVAPKLTEHEFLKKEFSDLDIKKLPIDEAVLDIMNSRLIEIEKGLSSQLPLSVIFLCGSVLEGILLGVASKNPEKFNKSKCAPKYDKGQVKQFNDRTLSNFIDTAYELGIIKEDVKKFSHVPRDFRNYIHPYQQLSLNFNPDINTAKICRQVLQAAIYQISS